MDPLAQLTNTRPQTVPQSGPSAAPSSASPLDPVSAAGKGAPPIPPPPKPPTKGASRVAEAESLSKALVPVSLAVGASLKPESFLAKKALAFSTGFKVGEAGELFNRLTPGAAMFLAPEPIGLLPERFFMGKPRIPGTNVYVDPLYNYTRYRGRKDDEKRAAAGAAQIDALKQLVPTLTTEQLSGILGNSEVRAASIAYADPRVVDSVLLGELEARRRADRTSGAGVSSVTARGDTSADTALAAEAVATFLSGDVSLVSSLPRFIAQPAGGALVRAGDRGPLAAAVPSASLQPEAITPTNDAALRNMDGADGIRRELVHERADP